MASRAASSPSFRGIIDAFENAAEVIIAIIEDRRGSDRRAGMREYNAWANAVNACCVGDDGALIEPDNPMAWWARQDNPSYPDSD